jgi:KipI family sensor histidine kinase inhibitor
MPAMPHAATRLLALGDSAWTVELGSTIDPEINARIMALADRVAQARREDPLFATVRDVVPTFRSLTVHFSPADTRSDALAERLLAMAQAPGEPVATGRHWRLPACFDPGFALDLPALAQAKGLRESQIIERLLATEFRVYMIGFLPGFPYMGGLPKELAMPRLASPRQRVPAHSIAVAGEMCAVYPWESPGGWNLLGRTPVPLFDLNQSEQPAMLAAGDCVRWYAVETVEYEDLLARCRSGQLAREAFLSGGERP